MPPQYAIHHQPQITETYIPNHLTSSKMNVSLRDSHPQYPTYSSTQPSNTNNVNFDFQNFYAPVSWHMKDFLFMIGLSVKFIIDISKETDWHIF
jgi:hypothetical protein